MKYEIKHRFTGAVLFALVTDSMRLCVEAAVTARADLSGANLSGAYLSGANLYGANLSGANLSGAYLYGADGQKITVTDPRPVIIGPIGSRADYMTAWQTNAGIYVRAGCFWNTLAAFKSAVEETHGENDHGVHYRAAIALIEARYTAAVKQEAA